MTDIKSIDNETLNFLLLDRVIKNPEKPALKFKQNGQWVDISFREYFEEIKKLSFALLSLGHKKSEKIAIFSNTRMEWHLLDLAITSVSGVTVPIYPSSTAEEAQFIVENSEACWAIVETPQHWQRIKDSVNRGLLKKVIQIDGEVEDHPNLISFRKFQGMGTEALQNSDRKSVV